MTEMTAWKLLAELETFS